MQDASAHVFYPAVQLVKRWWLSIIIAQDRPASSSKAQAALDAVGKAAPVAFLPAVFDIQKKVDEKVANLQPLADGVASLQNAVMVAERLVEGLEAQVTAIRETQARAKEEAVAKAQAKSKTLPSEEPAPSTDAALDPEFRNFMRDIFLYIIPFCYDILRERLTITPLQAGSQADLWFIDTGENKAYWFAEMKACQSEHLGQDNLAGLSAWLQEESANLTSNLYDQCNRQPPLTTEDKRIDGHSAKLFLVMTYLAASLSRHGLSSNGMYSNLVWARDTVKDHVGVTLGTLYRWELYESPRKPEELTDDSVLKFIKMMVYLYDQYGAGRKNPLFEPIPAPTQDELKRAAYIISESQRTPPGVLWIQWLRSFIPRFTFLPGAPSACTPADLLGASIVCQKPLSFSMPTIIWTNHEWCLRIICPSRFWLSSYVYIPLCVSHYSRQATILRGPGESFVVKVFVDTDSFNREVECLNRLEGLPGVPSLFACASVPGVGRFTITSYVGEPVLDLTLDEARTVHESIVEPMHTRGVHHHDLLQGNITRDKDGEFHIIDFGDGMVVQEAGICGGGSCDDRDWVERL
ncbi:hypothetical protein DFP72DRAFT_1070282 [Ephemerocybe angulata]|uniref:Protein kinase domain-containing protein n=1 Tax=Ephemerocybe angulata TaxID=980116 RepID=A0A8H6M251_9AGAR|nr:hypothetical protein DFP72DRAFT_1070282 [Tulosesus angulatus]